MVMFINIDTKIKSKKSRKVCDRELFQEKFLEINIFIWFLQFYPKNLIYECIFYSY